MEASVQRHSPAALSTGNNFGNHWIGDCGDPRAGLIVLEEKNLFPVPGFKPQTVQPVD